MAVGDLTPAERRALHAEFGVDLPETLLAPADDELAIVALRPEGAAPLTVLWLRPTEYERIKNGQGSSVVVPGTAAPGIDNSVVLLETTEIATPTFNFLYRRCAAVYNHHAVRSGWVVVDLAPLHRKTFPKAWVPWAHAVVEHARRHRAQRLTV